MSQRADLSKNVVLEVSRTCMLETEFATRIT